MSAGREQKKSVGRQRSHMGQSNPSRLIIDAVSIVQQEPDS